MSSAVRRRRREHDEAGISTVEVVIATPVMLLFILVLVALGQYASNIGNVQSAAQDAARMGSEQGTPKNQSIYARAAAWKDLSSTCNRDTEATMGLTLATNSTTIPNEPTPTGGAQPVNSAQSTITVLEVTVTCHVSVFGASYSIIESSYAPLDYFRPQP
jgi:Flp pilus assembly protein TadG